jgi:hypothetical protein
MQLLQYAISEKTYIYIYLVIMFAFWPADPDPHLIPAWIRIHIQNADPDPGGLKKD